MPLLPAILILTQAAFRPPAVPLITNDPYLSIWSESDHLYDSDTCHWTHVPQPLRSTITIDGKTYRLMGAGDADPLPQQTRKVTPTRSIYTFANNQVEVTLTFMTPLLPNDLSIYARPITYLTWSVRAKDGQNHQVQIKETTSSDICLNNPTDPTIARSSTNDGLSTLTATPQSPTLLQPPGDDTRINWGTLYAAAPLNAKPTMEGDPNHAQLAFTFNVGTVGAQPQERHMMIGYDEWFSIDYFDVQLLPYWYHFYRSPQVLFHLAEEDYPSLVNKCQAFDSELTNDLTNEGGAQYAQIAALSYRECCAACGLAEDMSGQPLLFTKENTSNGDIATVDVIFPMDPVFILLSPSLAKASLVAEFDYAASSHWKFPNAPHDLGTYPIVEGRDDGGEGMPVEESGNMIILTDAIAHAEKDPEFANRYWPQLTQWATFLEQYGLDPEDQLCTDDFMGHLAHNANLSVKAIIALAAYGDLAQMRGDKTTAERYLRLARTDAAHWASVADQGNHSLLAFDKPDTWSQKYNLVWDRILGLNVFPPDVAAKEIAYYKTVMQPFGLPLDSRTHLTKTDWTIWTATMATNKADFQSFVNPIYNYLSQTTTRDPIADSYMTDDPTSGGMHARPVVGGIFIKMLADSATWKKWASRDNNKIGNWSRQP